MRLTQLGSDPVSLTLYVLADDERTAEGLTPSYDGPVSRLEPAPPAELASLFEGSSYLTKLEAESVPASEFTSDIAIRPGEALATFGDEAGDDDDDTIVYILIALCVAVAALTIFLIVHRRRTS